MHDDQDDDAGEPTRGAILWIHAFPLHGDMWDDLTGALDGYEHFLPNLPGFGGRPAGEGALGMEEAADLLVHDLAAEGVERAVVAGCSMGGYVAMALQRRHPERVRALILIDTRDEPDTQEQRDGRAAQAKRVEAEGIEPLVAAMLPRLLKRPAGPAAEQVAAMIRAASPRGVANALGGMAARPDARPGLAEVRVPALVVSGADDVLIPLSFSERIAETIPGARLAVIPDCGHLPPVEAPAATARVIADFLASLHQE